MRLIVSEEAPVNILAKAVESCLADHPPMQSNWTSWRCPICGSPLVRDLAARRAHPECHRLHSDDQLACSDVNCPFTAYGNFAAKLMAAKGHIKACEPCAGTGKDKESGGPCQNCYSRGYTAPVSGAVKNRELKKKPS